MELVSIFIMFYHSFLLLNGSYWPFLTCFSLMNLLLGIVMWFSYVKLGVLFMVISLLLFIYSISLWYSDVWVEVSLLGTYTRLVKSGLMLGFFLFLITELLIFITLFCSGIYIWIWNSNLIYVGNCWPSEGLVLVHPLLIPFLNSILLLSSAVSLTIAHNYWILNKRNQFSSYMLLTLLLGIFFVIVQGYEFLSNQFSLSDTVYGSLFFMTTGLHGLHVIIGSLFIMVMFIGSLSYFSLRYDHLGLESSIIYWHFVDFIWIIVFILFYWLPWWCL